jgi:hypothetical protein
VKGMAPTEVHALLRPRPVVVHFQPPPEGANPPDVPRLPTIPSTTPGTAGGASGAQWRAAADGAGGMLSPLSPRRFSRIVRARLANSERRRQIGEGEEAAAQQPTSPALPMASLSPDRLTGGLSGGLAGGRASEGAGRDSAGETLAESGSDDAGGDVEAPLERGEQEDGPSEFPQAD